MLTTLFLYIILSSKQISDVWTSTGDIYQQDKIYEKIGNIGWDNWATHNLEDGDIVFIRGNEYFLGFNFSQYISEITAGEYTHCGIVRIEDKAYIYDMNKNGCRFVPFSVFVNESYNKKFQVKRLKKKYKENISFIIEYCQDRYIDEVQFDYSFRLGNDKLYCAEMITDAFKDCRLLLAPPVKVADFIGINDHPYKTAIVIIGSYLFADKPFTFDQKIYIVGNNHYGISSSKLLENYFEGKLHE